MTAERSIRRRVIILFCVTVGVLLAVSYVGLYAVFERVLRSELDQNLKEMAAPVIADLIMDPDEKDVDSLNVPGQYFEVLDASGRVLQRSRNLSAALSVRMDSEFQTIPDVPGVGQVRAAVLSFQAGQNQWLFVAAAPVRQVDDALAALRRFALALLPASLLLTAVVFGFFSNQLFSKIDAAVRQLRQFVSDAAHELRTPLAVLQGETELVLSRERTAEEYRAAAQVMDAELKKLTRIVDGLFTLSMADAGQLRIQPEPVYLEEVLEESCGLAAGLACQKNIQIERELKRDVLFNGDPAFLRQLFLIFLDNAIKYSRAGSRIRVALAYEADGVRASFEDEGIGIAKENLGRIFERFFRAAPASGAQSGGLGLAIAQAIAQAHQGTIECRSVVGVGSTFTVRFRNDGQLS